MFTELEVNFCSRATAVNKLQRSFYHDKFNAKITYHSINCRCIFSLFGLNPCHHEILTLKEEFTKIQTHKHKQFCRWKLIKIPDITFVTRSQYPAVLKRTPDDLCFLILSINLIVTRIFLCVSSRTHCFAAVIKLIQVTLEFCPVLFLQLYFAISEWTEINFRFCHRGCLWRVHVSDFNSRVY